MKWKEEFLKDVPTEFLNQIFQAINVGYIQSEIQVESQGLGTPEKKNLLPWQRRAQIEHRIKSAALNFGAPVEVTTENSGFWNHVVITCGRFRMTQSSIPKENCPLNPAAYKCKYAKQQDQMLFKFAIESEEAKSAKLENYFYAVILHHAPLGESEPEFVSIRFPSADLSEYHADSIDLVSMFGIEKPSDSTIPVEHIEDDAMPKLKKVKKAAGEL